MQELTLSPTYQTTLLEDWRRCALDMSLLTHEEQRASWQWKRFGKELEGALEMSRRRDDWKPKSARWLALVSELVRFVQEHVAQLWWGEVNGFGVLALLRNAPHRLAPALAAALPSLGRCPAERSGHYERAVVAILRSGHEGAVTALTPKVLEAVCLDVGRAGDKWKLRVQTHLVRFACAAGERVVRSWLDLEDAKLLGAALATRTQPLLKQLLATQTSARFPELRARQAALAQRLLSLAPPETAAGRRLLGLEDGHTRLSSALADCLRALAPHRTAEAGTTAVLVAPAAARRADVLEFAVAHGRAVPDVRALPADPPEEPGPEAGPFDPEGVVEALTLLCGRAPPSLGVSSALEDDGRAGKEDCHDAGCLCVPWEAPPWTCAAPGGHYVCCYYFYHMWQPTTQCGAVFLVPTMVAGT